MSILRTRGKAALTSRLHYICPRCKQRQFVSQSQSARQPACFPPTQTLKHDGSIFTRSLSTTLQARQAEAASATLSSCFPQPPPPLPTASSGRQSSVRNQLKTWSIQNQEKKESDAQQGLTPARRRKVEIPQSLYLEEEENEDDSYEDEDDYDLGSHEVGDIPNRENRIQPGDLVHYGRKKKKTLVLLISKIGESAFFLHSSGQWSTGPWRSLDYNVAISTPLRGFATEEELAPLREVLPKKPIFEETSMGVQMVAELSDNLPLHITQPLVDRLNELYQRTKSFRRRHQQALDDFYDRVADQSEYLHLRFDYLVQKALGLDYDSLDDAGRITAFLLVNGNPLKMVVLQPSAESTLTVMVIPKETYYNNVEVIKWSRQYQQAAADASKGRNVRDILTGNPLSSFIDKSRRIILRSRRIRSPTTIGVLGPSNQATQHRFAGQTESTGEEFSTSDKMIINFIWDTFARKPASKNRNKQHAVGSLILRAVGAYPKMQLDSRLGRLFLQEIGAMAPWTEGRDAQVILPYPGQKGQLGVNLDRQRDYMRQLSKDWPARRTEEGVFPLLDGMAHLRKDLDDMPVICIDAKSTRIVDDGISLEPCAERPGAWWIHVSIAHPSAFFAPDHPISQAARAMGASVYASGSTHFMITDRIATYLSLERGAEAFTVSTLLNENGEVLDIKVAATRVQNVVRLTKGAVSHLMEDPKPAYTSLIVGPDDSVNNQSEGPGDEESLEAVRPYLSTLKKIKSLTLARYHQRHKEVPVPANYWSTSITQKTHINWEERNKRDRLNHSFHYLSDPTIRVMTDRTFKPVRIADRDVKLDVTTHAMWLACESFGKWLKDRNIPAIFHGSQAPHFMPMAKLNKAGPTDRTQHPAPNIQTEAVPHAVMNMNQFVRITSPLRRFADLVNQWNADSYLLAEANGQVKPGAPGTNVDYAMSKEAVQEYLISDYWVIFHVERNIADAYVHWGFQAFFRAFHFKEAVLPEVWDVELSAALVDKERIHEGTGLTGWIVPFHLRCFFLASPEGYELRAKAHQCLPCKIELVDVAEKYIAVRAIGEATDMPQFEVNDLCTPEEKRIQQTARAPDDPRGSGFGGTNVPAWG